MAVVSMKFAMIIAVLVFTQFLACQADNTTVDKIKTACASQGQPINIHVDPSKEAKGDKGDQGTSCNCTSQKPSAHIGAAHLKPVTYSNGQVIKDWSLSALYSHLTGGMTYEDGKLTVPIPGRYYIYSQVYYHASGRVDIYVNNNTITMIQPMQRGTGEGALCTAGVFTLNAGDAISLRGTDRKPGLCKLYMHSFHTYFGAFQI